MDVPRTDRTVARGFDKDGNPLVIEGTGYFARCLQHETDHLLGRVYLDRLSQRDRKDAPRQMNDRQDRVFAQRAARAARLHRQVSGGPPRRSRSVARKGGGPPEHDGQGPPALVLTAGQAADSPEFVPVLGGVRVRLPVGRPRPRPRPDAKILLQQDCQCTSGACRPAGQSLTCVSMNLALVRWGAPHSATDFWYHCFHGP